MKMKNGVRFLNCAKKKFHYFYFFSSRMIIFERFLYGFTSKHFQFQHNIQWMPEGILFVFPIRPFLGFLWQVVERRRFWYHPNLQKSISKFYYLPIRKTLKNCVTKNRVNRICLTRASSR